MNQDRGKRGRKGKERMEGEGGEAGILFPSFPFRRRRTFRMRNRSILGVFMVAAVSLAAAMDVWLSPPLPAQQEE
jgi:hypothetical protein